MNSYKRNGFSLIELMIAVAIVAILAAIAFPSYQSYVVRSSRAAAQSELLQLAALQEKIFLNSNSYSGDLNDPYTGRSDGGLGQQGGITADGKYALELTPNVIPTQTFTITAFPFVGRSQDGDGVIRISSDGTRLRGSVPW